MKQRFQCFMCGYIEERELGGDLDGKRREGETPSESNLLDSSVESPEQSKQTSYPPCPRCGESKWTLLQSNQTDWRAGANSGFLAVWDWVTTLLSELVIRGMLFWKRVELYQVVILTRVVAFLGLTLGMYFLIRWFNCDFDRAAIFMILLYALTKWK